MRACAADGTVNQAAFGKPLPAIGLYIAGASMLCAVGMAVDALRGFLSRRPWFPCKYFTLNAVTLTVLAVAVKIPLDFNTPMPRPFDQLAKLSSTVLICTVIGNIIPSIGVTEDATSNISALAILVVTVAVNVAIQTGTGVVYRYLPEQGAILGIMLVLLALLISSALPLSTTKRHLEKLYDTKHQKIKDEGQSAGAGGDKFDVGNLREHVKKHWLMAHTSSPQYVLGRSVTCTASGALALLAALTLVEATARTVFAGRSGFCQGSSDYKWSVVLVYLSQLMAVVVGTIGPVCRWFTAVKSRRPDSRRESWKEEFRVEEYWVERLKELMEAPLGIQFTNSRRCQKIIIGAKSMILHAAIRLQTGFVLASKFVLLVSVWPVRWINYGGGLLQKLPSSVPGSSSNLHEYVLCLEGEENLVTLITRSERKDTERWIEKGRRKSPKNLTSLVESGLLPCAGGAPCFSLVALLDSDVVPSLLPGAQEPSHSWALPVATLASIAVAVAGEEHRGSALEQLMTAVEEGIKYVIFIERKLEAKGLLDQWEAVENFWPILSLHRRWCDLDLRRVAAETPSKRKAIEHLKESAEASVREYLNDKIANACLEWSPRMLAANCMYRLSSTILVLCDNDKKCSSGVEENMFVWVGALIRDLLCACLTNLPAAIYIECFSSHIEVREERVRHAAFLLGECEDIMLRLQNEDAAATYPEEKAYVDDWRARSISDGALQKAICTVLAPSSSSSNATAASLSGISWSSAGQSTRSIDSIEQDQPCPPLDVV